MSVNGIEQFMHAMPEVAQEQISRIGLQSQPLADGVQRHYMSGHDRGVAYRFFVHLEYNKDRSDLAEYEVFDEVECVQWYRSRTDKPVFMVAHLPADFLKFNKHGECVGGRWRESYTRWKQGLQAVGTNLHKWGILSDGEVASLEADGIYTVEQLADLPRDRMVGRYPQEFVEAYDRAKHFVASKDMNSVAAKQADRIKELEAKLAALEQVVTDNPEVSPKKVSKQRRAECVA